MNITHSYSTPGNYTVTLIIKDTFYEVNDTCIIHVTKSVSPNNPPIANAGSDKKVNVNQTVYFNGSGSYDPDGHPIEYYWDFGDGTITGWTNLSSVSHAYSQVGNYTVTLSVRDIIHPPFLMDNDTCIVQVTSSGTGNNPPIADAGYDLKGTKYQAMEFDASGSYDPDGDPLQYKWDFGDGNSTGWLDQNNKSHSYYQLGIYTVTLTVSDGSLTDSDTCIVDISTSGGSNNPPVADAGPDQNATVDQTVYFDGSGSYDPDNDPLQYKWDFGDGTTTGWTNLSTPNHVYNSQGNYTVKLTVSDGALTDDDTCMAYVYTFWTGGNRPPVTDAGPDKYIEVNESVFFNGSGSYDPDGDLLLFMWKFQDQPGIWSEFSIFIRAYTEIGTYVVTLFVTDGEYMDHDNCTVYVTKIYDTDGDGLPDAWEHDHGLDPNNANDALLDNDGDALTNLEEFKHNTNPNNKDTDGDSVSDGWEIQYDLDPRDATDASFDSDGDSLSNQEEFELGTNPLDKDSDGDGHTDNIDEYPNDPGRYENKTTDDQGIVESFMIIFIVIIIVIIIIIMVAVVYKNKRKMEERNFNDGEPLETRQEINDNIITEELEAIDGSDFTSQELIKNLKQEALVPDKPNDFGPSEQEILDKIEIKYQKGKITKNTYDSIRISLMDNNK
jgi:PKD repeat protein